MSRILAEWDAISRQAPRPVAPRRRIVVRSGLPSGMLVRAGLAVALVVAVVLVARNGPNGNVGGAPPVSPSASAAAVTPTSTPAVTPSPTPPMVPSPAPTPTALRSPSTAPTIGPCDPAGLAARITAWEGAAGNRIATVELVGGASASCTVPTMARPQLVDGAGSVLIDGSDPTAAGSLIIGPGETLTTLVNVANYCGGTPVAPVTVAFVLGDGARIDAAPLSATDATVPPCNGAPGSAGSIEMHPWSR